MQPISAVIPNRDGVEILRRTLPPLLQELSLERDEIIVIDDASEDDSVGMLGREFPTVRVVALERNVGFGAACNLGFERARHDLVLLLNSDMEVTPGSIALLAEHFEDPDVFATGPEYWSDDPSKPRPPRGPTDWWPQLGAPAGGSLFRRDKFLELGGFDPLYYPFYWEDVDLGWNAWRSGLTIVYDTRCHFVHLESATIRKLYSASYVKRIRARNRCFFGWKNFQSPWLRRRHSLSLVRRALGGLLRRGDASDLLGLCDAWRHRRAIMRSRRSDPALRTDEQILADSCTSLCLLLSL